MASTSFQNTAPKNDLSDVASHTVSHAKDCSFGLLDILILSGVVLEGHALSVTGDKEQKITHVFSV